MLTNPVLNSQTNQTPPTMAPTQGPVAARTQKLLQRWIRAAFIPPVNPREDLIQTFLNKADDDESVPPAPLIPMINKLWSLPHPALLRPLHYLAKGRYRVQLLDCRWCYTPKRIPCLCMHGRVMEGPKLGSDVMDYLWFHTPTGAQYTGRRLIQYGLLRWSQLADDPMRHLAREWWWEVRNHGGGFAYTDALGKGRIYFTSVIDVQPLSDRWSEPQVEVDLGMSAYGGIRTVGGSPADQPQSDIPDKHPHLLRGGAVATDVRSGDSSGDSLDAENPLKFTGS